LFTSVSFFSVRIRRPFCTISGACRVPALDFAVRRELEALPGAAVVFNFNFGFDAFLGIA